VSYNNLTATSSSIARSSEQQLDLHLQYQYDYEYDYWHKDSLSFKLIELTFWVMSDELNLKLAYWTKLN